MVTMTSIVSGVMKCVLSYSTMCMILVTCTWASLRARLVEWRGVTGTYLAVGAGAVSSVSPTRARHDDNGFEMKCRRIKEKRGKGEGLKYPTLVDFG